MVKLGDRENGSEIIYQRREMNINYFYCILETIWSYLVIGGGSEGDDMTFFKYTKEGVEKVNVVRVR